MSEGRTPSPLSGALSQAFVYYLHVTAALSALPPELCVAVINAGGCMLSTPSGPAVRDGVEGRTSLESFRDLSLKLFAFVGGENKQMLIKVSFVNQRVCVGTLCPLRPSIRVGLLHQHLGCSGTGTHPPPSTDPLPASLLREVFPDIPPPCSQ